MARSPAQSCRGGQSVLMIVVAVLAILASTRTVSGFTVAASPTTTASAAIFTYDAPALVRVDAHAGGDVAAVFVQVGVALEGSALPPVEAGGASTTPLRSFVATEAADAGVLAEDAPSVVRPASTPWGKTV